MADIDVTNKIEQLEEFEERLGVKLESLSAFISDNGDNSIYLQVRGELQARDSDELQQDVELVMAAYDSLGRVIGTSSLGYNSGEFFKLETFEFIERVPVNQLSRVRIYPKKR